MQHADPYRTASSSEPSAPKELVHLAGSPKLVAIVAPALLVVALVAALFASRVVEGTCAREIDRMSCDVLDSTLISTDRTHPYAAGVVRVRIATTYGRKGSPTSRLSLVSDSGETPLTSAFSGELAAQTRVAAELTELALSPPPARASFRFGSRLAGLPLSGVALVLVLALVVSSWQRVRLVVSPSDGMLEIARVSFPRRRSSALVLAKEIEGVAIESVASGRGRSYRLVIVLKDLTRVPIGTVYGASREAFVEEQHRIASWLAVAAIG